MIKELIKECNKQMELNLHKHSKDDGTAAKLSRVLHSKKLTYEDMVTWNIKFYSFGNGNLTVFDLMRLKESDIIGILNVKSYWILGNQYRDLEVDKVEIDKICQFAKFMQDEDKYKSYDEYKQSMKEKGIYIW